MENYNTLKKTKRALIVEYDVPIDGVKEYDWMEAPVENTLHVTNFTIVNDKPDSRIAAVRVKYVFDPKKPRGGDICLAALPRDPNDQLPYEPAPLPESFNPQWQDQIRQLLGTEFQDAYDLGMLSQGLCVVRTGGDTAYDAIVKELHGGSRDTDKHHCMIGDMCRKSLNRILSVINIAAERNGQVNDMQLNGIGDSSLRKEGR